MIKRYLACILAFAMILTTVSVFAADVVEETPSDTVVSDGTQQVTDEVEDNPLYTNDVVSAMPDTKDTQYETAVNLLSGLNVITGDEDGNFYPERDVTRAEATATVIRLIGQNSLAGANVSEQLYSDVPVGQWYTGYINSATRLGIIGGDGDGTFRPEDSVTYDEYIKMLISAVGYDKVAKYKGGFPSGYLQLARELDIIKGADYNSGQKIQRGNVALYAYNTLFVKELTVIYKANGQVSYSANDGNKTFLESWYDIEEVNGIVVANSVCGIDDDAVSDKSKITFELEDGSRAQYNVGNTNASDYLGYASTIYLKNDNNQSNLIISISLRKNKNIVTELDSFDVTELENNGGNVSVYYNKSYTGSDKKITVPSSANLVYNNKSMGTVGSQQSSDYDYIFSPASGNLKFIDNDQDNKAEVVFVNAYSNYIVDKVNVNTNKLTLKSVSTVSMELDPDASEYQFKIIKGNKEITLADLQEKDVVTLEESLGDTEKVYILYVSSEAHEGQAGVVEPAQGTTIGSTPTSKYAKNGTAIDYTPMNVRVDDASYDVVYDINININAGDNLAFYINSFGQIAYVEKVQSGAEQYALLTGISADNGVFGDNIKLQLFTERGILAEYKLKNKVTWDEGGLSDQMSAKDVTARLRLLYPNLYKMIKFTINADSEISSVLIAGSPGNGYYDENAFTLDYNSISSTNDVTTPEETVYFTKGTPARIGSLYALKEGCKFFTVPVNSDDLSIDADKIRVVSSYDSVNTSSNILCDVYDANRNMSADACVYYYAVGGYNAQKVEDSDSLFLVDNTSETVDEDGSKVYALTGLKDGQEVEIRMEDTVELNQESGNVVTQSPKQVMASVQRGYVLQFKLDSDGKMDKYRVSYNLSDYIWPSGTNTKYTDRDLELGYFTIAGIGDGVIVFNNPAKGNYRTLVLNDSIPVYKYNKKQKKVTIGSTDDLELDGTVFIRIAKDNLKEIIIYEED